MPGAACSRRRFLALVPGALALVIPEQARAELLSAVSRGDHPTPRSGIDASKVLKADQLHTPDAAPVFDLVRQMPQVVDGIRCNCGCAELPGYYSLLFEDPSGIRLEINHVPGKGLLEPDGAR